MWLAKVLIFFAALTVQVPGGSGGGSINLTFPSAYAFSRMGERA
jgi:hypothetical protein